MTINQVVAYNLTRARRQNGWSQKETAQRLTVLTGRSWTPATLGAAERSREGMRVKEFHADELLAFSVLFDMPLARFLLPPDTDQSPASYALGPEGSRQISRRELLDHVLARQPRGRYHDLVDAAIRSAPRMAAQ